MPVCNEMIFYDFFNSLYRNDDFPVDVFQQIFVRTRRVLHLLFNKFLGNELINDFNIVDSLQRIARQAF